MDVDITTRKNAEAALRASEERYRAFVEQSSEAIWRFELEKPVPVGLPDDEQIERCYRYCYLAECNDVMARMYGYAKAEEIIGARLGDLLPRSDPKNIAFMRQFIRSDYRLVDAESHEVDKHGQPKYFLNNLVAIVEHGHILRAWGTQRDITGRKRIEESVRTLSRRLLDAQETERRRVARELHDGVNQLISATKFKVLSCAQRLQGLNPHLRREVAKITRLLDQAMHEIRRISHNLRPAVLDDLGLAPALRSTCEEFRLRTGVKLNLRCARLAARLSPETELALFRILQESLNNIERHAKARRVSVRLAWRGTSIALYVKDDGSGIPLRPAGRRKSARGLGLDHMRERAITVGGEFVVKPGRPAGTEICVRIPVASKPSTR